MMSSDAVLGEMLDVLKEIRDLLKPVADAHQDAYDERQAAREVERLTAIRSQLSSEKRRQAWALADGTHAQREIARLVGMDAGAISRFFKGLRDLGALTDATSPTRALEVDT